MKNNLFVVMDGSLTMVILFLANNSGGLYDFRGMLIEKLLRRNVVLCSTPFDDKIKELEELGCELIETPIERRGMNPVRDMKLFLFYWKLIKDKRPDLVITYTIKPNVYGGAVSRILRIPYAVNITGLGTAFQNKGFLRKMVVCMYRYSVKKAKVIFFENVENRGIFVNERIAREEKTCVLNGAGVDLERFQLTDYPLGEVIRFVFIGRVMREKGIDELFSAMHRLWADGTGATVDILGGYEENYKESIEKYEDEGWLRYHGYQEDVRPFIANAHCFVLPSWHEGMANTNLECAAMGRPLITSRIHGCMEAVEEGITGLLCEKKNADSLYEVMKEFCGYSYDRRKEMGKMGRKRMERMFDKEKVVFKTMEQLSIDR